jgi:antitoxin (DNA-binding transcriptional repressor) of toxin-antitoxin stability system
MKEAKISEVKNQLSRYLALVRRGEVVRILDRNVPIAQIVPITAPAGEGRSAGAEVLPELERRGLIRRGSGRIPREILEKNPPGRPAGVLAALLDERRAR